MFLMLYQWWGNSELRIDWYIQIEGKQIHDEFLSEE